MWYVAFPYFTVPTESQYIIMYLEWVMSLLLVYMKLDIKIQTQKGTEFLQVR